MKTALTTEQSARLIELGVDKKLASDSAFVFDEQGNEVPCVKDYALKPNEYCAEIQFADEDSPSVMAYIFTLQDLLALLPKKITDRRNIYNLNIGVNSEDLWYAKYLNDNECWDTLNSYQEDNELCDCIYDMIVWLKENKELTWL